MAWVLPFSTLGDALECTHSHRRSSHFSLSVTSPPPPLPSPPPPSIRGKEIARQGTPKRKESVYDAFLSCWYHLQNGFGCALRSHGGALYFYQAWQQQDCSLAAATKDNPSGCLNDLFPFVMATYSASNINQYVSN